MRSVIIALCIVFIACSDGHKHENPMSRFRPDRVLTKPGLDIQLSVSPKLLNNSGEWVTVTYSGHQNPSMNDFIAVYSPSNVNISITSPVKYQFANYSTTYMSTGSGSLTFRLINMFADYGFAFFTNGTQYPILVSFSSDTVEFTNYQQPLQPHLALTPEPYTMRLTWAAGVSKKQFVQWGTKAGVYTTTLQSETTTYTADDMCGDIASGWGWRDPGLFHSAIITFSPSTTRIFYRFGSNETGWSDESSFMTPPPVSASSGIKFVAYGDMGKAEADRSLEFWMESPSLNTTKNVESLLSQGEVDLVIHIGDISYAVGFSAQWDEFFDQIAPVATRVPYMTLPGNHERDYINSGSIWNLTDSGGECGIPYETRLPMPNTDHDVQWYSFNFGNVHFVMMSTELNFSRESPQWEFILQDLQNVDRTKTPWVIFSGHRPMYIDAQSNTSLIGNFLPVALALRESLEDMLVKYEVDLAFWGHHHSYQRSCPLFNEECYFNQQYPVHAIIGMAGMGLAPFGNSTPSWLVYGDDFEYGYTTIETTEKTLHMSYFNNNNVLRDDFWLVKPTQ